MAEALPALIGVAGGTYAAKRKVKTNSSHFHQRMRDAEQYGIHPLQAIGSAGTLQGTGGASIGSLIQNEQNSRKYYAAKKDAEDREDTHRKEDRDHEILLQQMRNSAEDPQLTRSLNDDLRQGADYLYPQGFPSWETIDNYIDNRLQPLRNDWEGFKFKHRRKE